MDLVLPASVGMIPPSFLEALPSICAPRIRRDDPSVVVFDCAPCIFRDAPCSPLIQANPKETSWTGSIHSVGSRWRSASAASPSSSGSRSRQGSSDWPLAVSALQRDAANDLQVPQHDAGGSTPRRGLVRASHYRLPAPPTCTWAAPAAGMKALSTTGTPPDQAAESAAADHARMLSASVGMILCPMCFRP